MMNTYGPIENYFAEGLEIDVVKQQAIRELYLQTGGVE
jgi:hypothetical protein